MAGKNKQTPAAKDKRQNQNPAETANLPLFFTNPRIITLEEYAKAKLRPDITLAFARLTNSIPLTMAEIPEAARHYPIVFTQSDPVVPVAIVGLETQNYFVDEQGKWLEGHYVPAYVRKYPFIFTQVPGSDQLALCVDESALVANSRDEGKLLYEDGKPSTLVNNALEFCGAYQEQHRYIREFCDILKQKEMLLPHRSDVKLANERKIQLGGFQVIDVEKFKSLSEPEVFQWFKRGYLEASYHIMNSHANWRVLLDLAMKYETGSQRKRTGW